MPERTTRTPTKRTVADRLRALLAAEGYRPRRAQEEKHPEVIHFKVEGNLFLLRFEEDDPDFVQVSTGYLLEDSTRDELALLRAGNEIQDKWKAVKVWFPKSRAFVELQVELFLGGRPFTAGLLGRSIGTLRAAGKELHGLVTPGPPKARA